MNSRLSVRLTDELAAGIDSRAERLGKTKSEVVREALTSAGLARRKHRPRADLLERAAALRARQPEPTDAAALVREIRGGSVLRLELRQLRVPIMQADLG